MSRLSDALNEGLRRSKKAERTGKAPRSVVYSGRTVDAAIAKGVAIIFATVYLRHLLPVSGISFFYTPCQSMPFSPVREAVRKDLCIPRSPSARLCQNLLQVWLWSRSYTGLCFTPVRVLSTLRVPTTPLTEWSRGESNPCAVRISIQYQQYQSVVRDLHPCSIAACKSTILFSLAVYPLLLNYANKLFSR